MSTEREGGDREGGDEGWPRPAQAWYAVGVLIVVYLVALVDRQILTLLVEPIKRDLGLNDTQLSLLIGLAFALFYTVLGVPIAALADRRPRRTIIAVGVFFWSLATAACGLAQNYWQLFVARVGVGVGEAALQPSAYSMLADYFPPRQLGRAIGTYASGLFLGGGLALVLGGAVVGALSGAESVVLPLVGELRVWQVAFVVVGLPGVLLSLLIMLTVREPLRRGVAEPGQGGELRPFFRQNAATLTTILAAFSLGGIAVVGCLAWVPEFIRRTHGWSIEQTGYVFGVTMAVFGTAGTLFGGWFLDWLTRRGYADAAIRASIIAFTLLVPAMVLPTLFSNPVVSVALLAPLMFVIGMQQGYSPVALQMIAPNQIRARVVAIFFLVAQVFALGFGPTAVALVTDYVFGDDAALRWSIAMIGGGCCAAGLLVLVAGLGAYRRSVERARANAGGAARGASPEGAAARS